MSTYFHKSSKIWAGRVESPQIVVLHVGMSISLNKVICQKVMVNPTLKPHRSILMNFICFYVQAIC